MDRGQHFGHGQVVNPPLDPDGTLCHSGQHRFRLDGRFWHVVHRQPVQTSHRKKGRLGHAIVQLFETGLHVATKFNHLKVRAAQLKLCFAPQTGRPHHRPPCQIIQSTGTRRDKGITHVFARQIGVQHQTLRLQHWHVFHGMHGDVDFTCQHVLFDLAGEQTFAADFFQRAVDDLVTGGLDDHDRECLKRQVKCFGQTGARFVCLGQRQRRATGADVQRILRGGKL